MSNFKFLFSLLVVFILVLQSCSIDKRHYTSGYHLQWKKGNSELRTKNSEVSSNSAKTLNTITASSEKKKGIVLLTADSIACDTLIMKNGTEIKAKVLEVTPTEIKYKFCNNINGPLYVAYRYNLSYIKYANGTMDSFVSEHPPLANQPTNRNNVPNNPNGGGYNQNNYNQYNRSAFNGTDSQYAIKEYVRKTSTASLVCGIVSFFISLFGIITAIIAIVLGNKCLRLIKQDPQNLWMYQKTTNAGIILGWIALIGKILLWTLIIALIASGI